MDISTFFRVDGMVAVITGGGTGIGLSMAKALARNGARVYILGRRAAPLEAAARQDVSQNTIPLVCDVTSKASLQRAVDKIALDVGYVNLLVANAGILGPVASYDEYRCNNSSNSASGGDGRSGNRSDAITKSISALRAKFFSDSNSNSNPNDDESVSEDDSVSMSEFTQTLHVNITSAYFTLLAFLELLDAGNRNAVENGGYGRPLANDNNNNNNDSNDNNSSGSGSSVPRIQSQIIITSSVGAFSREKRTTPAYAASKAAVAHLAQHAATNLAPFQIRVNTLAPGYFASEMTESVFASRNPETEDLDHPDFIPARRFGTEEEIAGTILYLASNAGAYCNGSVLLFDGGRLAVIPSTY